MPKRVHLERLRTHNALSGLEAGDNASEAPLVPRRDGYFPALDATWRRQHIRVVAVDVEYQRLLRYKQSCPGRVSTRTRASICGFSLEPGFWIWQRI